MTDMIYRIITNSYYRAFSVCLQEPDLIYVITFVQTKKTHKKKLQTEEKNERALVCLH